MTNLLRIDFRGDELWCVEHDGKRYVAVKRICEAIGIAWQSQWTKLKSNPVFNCNAIVTVANDGLSREMLCIPVEQLPFWLSTVQPNRVLRENVRAKLVLYQKECAHALNAYWTHGAAINPRASDEQLSLVQARIAEKLDHRRLQIAAAEVVLKTADVFARYGGDAMAAHLVADAGRLLLQREVQATAPALLTVAEFLERKGLTEKDIRSAATTFGKLLAGAYRQRHGMAPPQSKRFVDGTHRLVNVYTTEDESLFEQVWHTETQKAG